MEKMKSTNKSPRSKNLFLSKDSIGSQVSSVDMDG